MPGLADGLAVLGAWQRTVGGVMDDAAAYLVTLVTFMHLAPVVRAVVQEAGAAAMTAG